MKNKNYGSNIIENKQINYIDSKEYSNLNEYYLKVGYNNINELIIIIYNNELLNGNRYELKRGLESIISFHKNFKSSCSISDIYKQIICFINEGKYKIKLNHNDTITLTFNKIIEFNLIRHKEENEYLHVLSSQIRNLKNKNNICNKTILKLQEENASIKNELNELKNMILSIQNNTNNRKSPENIHNSHIKNKKLNLNKSFSNLLKNRNFNLEVVGQNSQENDFMSINEFNKKCGANIKDENIPELNLINFKLGNDILNYLSKIKLTQLKLLYLSYNNISDIKNLKYILLNHITLLILSYNKIVDISVLENVKFDELQILGLSSNKISDISVLEKVKFSKLQNLFLDGNQIINIDVFGKVKFPLLKELNLSSNKINNINVFSRVKFNQLEELYLTNNNISDINVFEKVKFEHLQKLELGGNIIEDINVLSKVKFLKLKKLFLYMNKISEIEVLNHINFKEMNELNLNDNSIDKKSNEALIKELKQKIKNCFI